MNQLIEMKPSRLSERDLNFGQLCNLKYLCDYCSLDRTYALAELFNNNSRKLQIEEKIFLINYVVTRKAFKEEEFKLYRTKHNKQVILSKQQVAEGGYSVIKEELQDSLELLLDLSTPEEIAAIKKEREKQILNDLQSNEFQILEWGEELLAFCPSRNIVFYDNNLSECIKYYGSTIRCNFMQPYIYDNKIWIARYNSPQTCKEEKTPFPIFTNNMYLRLYKSQVNPEDYFTISMKKIAAHPILYEAVGPENQAIIDSVLSEKDTNKVPKL